MEFPSDRHFPSIHPAQCREKHDRQLEPQDDEQVLLFIQQLESKLHGRKHQIHQTEPQHQRPSQEKRQVRLFRMTIYIILFSTNYISRVRVGLIPHQHIPTKGIHRSQRMCPFLQHLMFPCKHIKQLHHHTPFKLSHPLITLHQGLPLKNYLLELTMEHQNAPRFQSVKDFL